MYLNLYFNSISSSLRPLCLPLALLFLFSIITETLKNPSYVAESITPAHLGQGHGPHQQWAQGTHPDPYLRVPRAGPCGHSLFIPWDLIPYVLMLHVPSSIAGVPHFANH